MCMSGESIFLFLVAMFIVSVVMGFLAAATQS
jgi:hypothetical protein